MRLPSFPYAGDAPEEYAHRDDVVRFIESYAAFIKARCEPVSKCGRFGPSPSWRAKAHHPRLSLNPSGTPNLY
jgi:hypothetical protein